MGLIETEGLVLKSYGLSEADKIILFLTKSEGIVRGVARGAKRLKSRFGGVLEPFSIVHLSFFQKEERELVSIRDVELIESNFKSASDPVFLQRFAYLTELLIEFAPPHDPNEKLYRMARVCLETAGQEPANLESMVVYFELWLLRLAGYLPDWKVCDGCKNPFLENQVSILQINFHLFCQTCQKYRNDWVISPVQRRIFMLAQKLAPSDFAGLTKDLQSDLFEISTILKRIISHILGREVVFQKSLIAG